MFEGKSGYNFLMCFSFILLFICFLNLLGIISLGEEEQKNIECNCCCEMRCNE